MKRKPSSPLTRLINSYHALLGVYLLLRLIFGSGWWWLGVLHTFALWLFMPLLLTTPLAFLLRGRRTRIIAVILLAVGLVRFAPLPFGVITSSNEAHDLRVLTFNTWVENQQIEESVDWILAQSADVVILQELVEGNLSQLSRLQTAFPHNAHIEGSVQIFSRYPFLEAELVTIDPADENWHGRSAVRTVVDIDGRAITVYGVHLSLPRREQPHFNIRTSINTLDFILRYDETHRNRQIHNLLGYIQAETNPVILAGDFNTSHTSPIINNFSEIGLRDAFLTVGADWGMTYPYLPPKYPMIRIDYIWYSSQLRPLRMQVGEFIGSDHLPLVVDFSFN